MLLIADSGSTKTTWCLVDSFRKMRQFETEGYNPCYSEGAKLIEILKPNLPEDFEMADVKEIAFYGAGVFEEKYKVIYGVLHPIFPNAKIEAVTDLLASARALLGRDSGFAAILGTGCNSCLYNGKTITHHIESMGFLLGDEGSGGYMGKRLIRDYIRGYMPEEVRKIFLDTFKLTGRQLIEQLYASPMPNRFCASFTSFLTSEHAGHEYLEQRVIRGSFRDFFNNVIKYYPHYQDYSFNSVGAIGWIFRNRLTAVATEFGMKTGTIICDPMEGLLKYHLS